MLGPGESVRDYLLTLLVTAAVTYMLTPLVRRLAIRIGAIKEPRGRDVHVVPVPLIGGVAMYAGLVAGLLIAEQIPQLRQSLPNTGMVSGLLLAGGLLVGIGIVDDRWGMSALTKGCGQVAAGAILVATGSQLSWLPMPGGSTFVPTTNQSTVLTILVVVATINAVNFIDGLDGLAAGIVAIAAISFFLYYYSLTKVIYPPIPSLAAPALASAILIGMCLGFLPYNFSPARIFMGDTGAMLLGLMLAYAMVSCITSLPPGNLTSQVNRYPVILPLLLPAALLVIPYGDLLLAVVRRTKAGLSPFAADRKHLHHRLLDIGHSQRASVLIMYLWAAVFSGSVVWLSLEKTRQPSVANHHGEPVVVFIAITVGAAVALLLLSMPRLRWWRRAARPTGSVAAPAAEGIPDEVLPAAGDPRLVTVAAVAETERLTAPQLGNGGRPPGATEPAWPGPGVRGADQAEPSSVQPSGPSQPEAGWTQPARLSDRIQPGHEHSDSAKLTTDQPGEAAPGGAPSSPGRSVVGMVPPAVASPGAARARPSRATPRQLQADSSLDRAGRRPDRADSWVSRTDAWAGRGDPWPRRTDTWRDRTELWAGRVYQRGDGGELWAGRPEPRADRTEIRADPAEPWRDGADPP